MMRLMRSLHLYLFLIVGFYTLFYALSGAVMLHQDLFPGGITKVKKSATIDTGLVEAELAAGQARKLGLHLGREFEVTGRLTKFGRRKNGHRYFIFERPGTLAYIDLDPKSGNVQINIEKKKFAAVMNRLHHLHGFQGGAKFALWGFFVDFVSVSLILFSISGIYLWFRTRRNRLVGWLILGGSGVYIVGSLVFVLVSR